MSVAPEQFSSRRDTLLFATCLLLAVVARLAPPEVQHAVASAVRGSVLAPLLFVQHRAEDLNAAQFRYNRLLGQRDSLFVEALAADALEEENQRLRELLALSARLPVRHVSAVVLHQAAPTDGYTFVLSAGRDHGVTAAAPVVAPGGLVGVVRSVEARTSVAIVWAHPDFRVSAMSQDGEVFGIIAPHGTQGPSRMMLQLEGVPYRDVVPPGTRIFTSGLGGSGGVYPRGIPIGSVLALAEERTGWSRTYLVRPAVQPAAVSHVVILTGPAVQLRDAFEPASP